MELILLILLGLSVVINLTQYTAYLRLKERHTTIKEINDTVERRYDELFIKYNQLKDKTS